MKPEYETLLVNSNANVIKKKEIYVIEYKYPLENGVWGSKINSDGFIDLDEAREWCGRNGAIPNENKMMYKWVENGDNAYIIHPITIR